MWNLTLSVKPSKPSKRLFGSHNLAINSFFLAFKPAVCQPSKAPNAFLAAPTPEAKAPRPHQQLFLGIQACRLPALKPSKSSAGQGTKAPSIAFSCLPFASPQTLQTLFWQPQPRRPRHQGPINSFFLAFKPAVCQPSNPPNAFLAAPTPQAKAPRPHQ